MKLYFAPLEGITGRIYRNAYNEYFGQGVDKFYTPFIAVNQNGIAKSRAWEDIIPENNVNIKVIPQLLGNKGEETGQYIHSLAELGYHEININLGCPYPTVVSKNKGAGLLNKKELLLPFLDGIFETAQREKTAISIKTRIGMSSREEFEPLVEIYNQYPLKELIVHPRIREDFYKGEPDLNSFAWAMKESKAPVCYNGDVFTLQDYQKLMQLFPKLDRMMLGRGPLANPCFIPEIITEEKRDKMKIEAFHNRLYTDYRTVMSGDRNTLFKMKELWNYMQFSFEDSSKCIKKIRKAQTAVEYERAVKELFALCPLKEGSGFETI